MGSMKMLLGAVMLLCVTTRATTGKGIIEIVLETLSISNSEMRLGTKKEQEVLYGFLTDDNKSKHTKYDTLRDIVMKMGHARQLIKAVQKYKRSCIRSTCKPRS